MFVFYFTALAKGVGKGGKGSGLSVVSIVLELQIEKLHGSVKMS